MELEHIISKTDLLIQENENTGNHMGKIKKLIEMERLKKEDL